MEHRRKTAVIGLMVGVWSALGCAGVFGYGEELGAAPLTSGQAFEVAFTPNSEDLKSHTVWLRYDIEHTQPYRLHGSMELEQDGKVLGTWQVDFTAQGSPIVGGSARLTMNTTEFRASGKSSAQGTVRMTPLPALGPGRATLRGTVSADAGTRLTNTRIVVTD